MSSSLCAVCEARLQQCGKRFDVSSVPLIEEAEGVCHMCFGVFEDVWCVNSSVMNMFRHRIESDGYEIHDYMLSVEVPAHLVVREVAVMLHHNLKIHRSSTKDVLRGLIDTRLRMMYDGRYNLNAESDLTLALVLSATKVLKHETKRIQSMFDELKQSKPQPKSRKKSRNPRTRKVNIRHVSYSMAEKQVSALTSQLLEKYKFMLPNVGRFNADLVASCSIERLPVCVCGYYTKLSRTVSQTPFFEHVASSSVQDEICKVLLPKFRAEQVASFHAAGREDVDVRMLGNGRFFMLELKGCKLNPRTLVHDNEWWATIQQEINSTSEDVQVHTLRWATRKLHTVMQSGSEEKQKSYRCVCLASSPVSKGALEAMNSSIPTDGLQIQQKTPVRVSHRRALLSRPRTISALHAEWVNSKCFFLDLTTQAGTYVKEFVHGDRGRTTPSISSILNCMVDIVQLDVTDVHFEPPNLIN